MGFRQRITRTSIRCFERGKGISVTAEEYKGTEGRMQDTDVLWEGG